jgi:hypothetical protein
LHFRDGRRRARRRSVCRLQRRCALHKACLLGERLRQGRPYIANWTKSKGIKTYTVGKKEVSCELFLNLIVVDEHTCKASALVCWPDGKRSETKASAAGGKAP